jgi:hypothetical protein
MSNYDNNCQGLATLFQNTLALQELASAGTPGNLNWSEGTERTTGSQWMWGFAQSDPTTITSNGPGYIYAAGNLTGMYNRSAPWSQIDNATDVSQATRSILWLNNAAPNNTAGSDYIVIYDRATTLHSGLFKKFNLSLVNAPVTQGRPTASPLRRRLWAMGSSSLSRRCCRRTPR